MKSLPFIFLPLFLAFLALAEDAKSAKPELDSISPRAMQSGTTAEFSLRGKNLTHLKAVLFTNPKIKAELLPASKSNAVIARVKISVDKALSRGTHELWGKNSGGESNRLKIHIGDLPQIFENSKAHPIKTRCTHVRAHAQDAPRKIRGSQICMHIYLCGLNRHMENVGCVL